MPGSLIVTCGIPGSGKSTWAKTMLPSAAHVSSDSIREELSHVNDQTRNGEVFEIFHERIAGYLKIGGTIVADSTALDSRSRATLRAIARLHDAYKHLILFANIEQAVARNLTRDRVVPADVMMRMLEKYERTCMQLPIESQHWNSVTTIGAWTR